VVGDDESALIFNDKTAMHEITRFAVR